MSGDVVMFLNICFIEEARRERNTVVVHRNLVELEVRTCVKAEVQMAGRAYLYFGTLLLPAITSDRHPTDDLRPHAVLEIRRELSLSASCTLASR